jgi:hypothetical protein
MQDSNERNVEEMETPDNCQTAASHTVVGFGLKRQTLQVRDVTFFEQMKTEKFHSGTPLYPILTVLKTF